MMCEVLTEKIGRLTGTRDEGRRPALFRALAPRWLTPLLALVCFAPAAWSQGLNLDFGTSYGVPASAYGAAAGQAGSWNQVGLGVSGLLELSGVASSASVNLVASTASGNTGAVPVDDDELLLADNFFTTSGGTWSVTLSGLSVGDYRVYLYAASNSGVPSGAMTVGGTAVASIPGDPGSALVEGTSWVAVDVVVSGGTLALSGTANLSGLAGLQLVPLAGTASINLDFGTSYGIPAPAYGAASGQAGSWNQVGLGVSALVDLSGVASGASVNLVASTAGGNTGGPPVNDDELLLADNFFTGSGGTWSVTLSGLATGDYLVYLYAPSNAAVPSGALTVGGTAVASIPGDPGSALVEGTSWVKTRVCLSDGTLAISGSANLSGLAGLQLAPAPPFESYCTAGVSASGCAATLMGSGVPSATAVSGFTLSAAGVEGGKNGIYFFGSNGRQANSWGSGTSFQCVVPPVGRAGLLSGSGTTGLCDGSFAQDFNALWCPACPKPAKNPGAGAVVQVQLWYRDPFNTSNQTTSLSDAIEFCVGP